MQNYKNAEPNGGATLDQLMQSVPVYNVDATGVLQYVRLKDIPNPYRSEFAADLYDVRVPYVAGQGPCQYAHRWWQWLDRRFAADYALRLGGWKYQELTDAMVEEMTAWLDRSNSRAAP